MIEEALLVAVAHHVGKTDKQGFPYVMHLIRVAGRCRTELEMTVAILHDAVEDTELTLDAVRTSFGDEVADVVDHLSKRDGEEYFDYLRRARQNELAERIKLYDIIDHLCREDCPLGLRNRYLRAYRLLAGHDWKPVKEGRGTMAMTKEQKLATLVISMHEARLLSQERDPETAHADGEAVLVEALQVLARGTQYHRLVSEIIQTYNDPTFKKW